MCIRDRLGSVRKRGLDPLQIARTLIGPASNLRSARTAQIPKGPARSHARTAGGPRFEGLAD
eukprot:5239315-Alexandrium_andersonii.AAC.1